jgi:hypothetical protein
MKKTARILISMLMTAGALVGIVSVAPSAYAMCDYDQVYISTPYAGRKVWIPTSTFSAWKRGGSISRTESQSALTSTTKGAVHNVTVEGKVGTKIGPVGVQVTSTYNGTWSRSTTTSSSFTSRWAYHFSVPTDTLYRARAYKLGYIYKYKRTTTYLGGCAPQVSWLYAATPVRSNTGTYYWGLERYSNAGKYRYDAL